MSGRRLPSENGAVRESTSGTSENGTRCSYPNTPAPLVLIPFDRRECLSLSQAADIAGRTTETVKRWCIDYKLGRLVGGRYAVSHVALLMHLEDNRRALAAYHAGHRNSPHVVSYLERVGIFALEISESHQALKIPNPRTHANSGIEYVDRRDLAWCGVPMKIDVDPNYLTYRQPRFPDCISASAPLGMRADVKRAAQQLGVSAASFVREAVGERLRSTLTEVRHG